jgi:IclR family mhp operon transcriptional activator
MFERDAMVVRYSTIPTSRLSWYRTTLHHRLGLRSSAMGIVFLAFSAKQTRALLLSSTLSETSGVSGLSEERFEQVKSRGYAIRIPTPEHPTLSLSVPLLAGDQVIAALSMTLFGRAMSANEAMLRYLDPLRTTSAEILALAGNETS